MNKSFAVVLGLVGAVSAVAGASPAMAHFAVAGPVTQGGLASPGTIQAAAPGNSLHYSLAIAPGAFTAVLTLTPMGFTVQQSLVSIDCNSGTASTYSVGTGMISVACPPLSTTVSKAEALISVN